MKKKKKALEYSTNGLPKRDVDLVNNCLSIYQGQAQAGEMLVELRDDNESRVTRKGLCPSTKSFHQSASHIWLGLLNMEQAIV